MLVRVFLIATIVPAAGRAQDAAPLTLDSAVQEALARNAALRAARAGASEATADASAARSGFYPRISFVEGWQRGSQPVFVFSSLLSARRFAAPNFAIDALNHPAATAFFHAAFGVEQVLFDGGRTRAAARTAAARRDMASAGATRAEADIVVAMTTAYGRVLAAMVERRAADGALESGREDLARGERRRDGGTATDADVLSLSVHLAAMQQRAIEAAGDEAVARADLNRVAGAPLDRAFTVSEPAVAATDAGDLPALFAAAESARPELQQAEAARRIGAAAEQRARAAWLPQVAVQGTYQSDGLSFADRASAWTVGGELRWSLSASGAERAQQRAAAHAVARADAEREAARDEVRLDVLTAVRRLESARQRLAVAAAAVAQSRESQRIIRDRFDAGLAPTTDVLRAASAVLDAEHQRVSAVVDAAVSDAMLRRATGRLP